MIAIIITGVSVYWVPITKLRREVPNPIFVHGTVSFVVSSRGTTMRKSRHTDLPLEKQLAELQSDGRLRLKYDELPLLKRRKST